jgi:hypothetical protein
VSSFCGRGGEGPGTTIHYRIKANNGDPGGPVYGRDRTYTFPGTPSAAAITAALTRALSPSGPAAKIGALLAEGSYPATVTASGAGTAQIAWYYVPPGAHIASAKPVVVAKGVKKVTKAGAATVKVKLTATGRRMLKRVKAGHTLKLTAKGSIARTSGKKTTRTKKITLKR